MCREIQTQKWSHIFQNQEYPSCSAIRGNPGTGSPEVRKQCLGLREAKQPECKVEERQLEGGAHGLLLSTDSRRACGTHSRKAKETLERTTPSAPGGLGHLRTHAASGRTL